MPKDKAVSVVLHPTASDRYKESSTFADHVLPITEYMERVIIIIGFNGKVNGYGLALPSHILPESSPH